MFIIISLDGLTSKEKQHTYEAQRIHLDIHITIMLQRMDTEKLVQAK